MPISAMQDVLEAPPIIEEYDKSSRMEDLNTLALDPKSMDCDTWPFNWAAVDVPGSPGLSRLFNALDIECSLPIPPLSLDARIPEESQYISGTGILDLWNGNNKSLVYNLDASCSSRQLDLTQASPRGQTQAFLWRDPKLAFYGWSESPLNEIYVFPPSPTKALQQPPSSRKPFWAKLETRAAELRAKLSKLKPLLGVEHPGVIAMMEDLANIYVDQGSYQKAEKLRRCVVNAMRKSLGTTNLKTIAAWQKLVWSLVYQGQYLHAQTLLGEMHSVILKLVNPDHHIATEAALLMAKISQNLDEDEKAEGLIRQVLQIQLNTLGPRSYRTWTSLKHLGFVLGLRQKYSEAEKLLRTTLQLHYEFAELEVEEDFCNAMCILSCTFYYQGLYKESEDIARRAVERFEVSLSPEHPSILNTHVHIARSIAARGKYLESEDIYRTVWKQQSKLLGESHPQALFTAWGLAISLENMERLEEATIWYEKSFWGDLGVYGPDGNDTIRSCYWLGRSYEMQGRYDDAMKLYRQLVERIQAVKGNDHPAIAEVKGWIERVQSRPLEGEEDTSGEETDSLSEKDDEDIREEMEGDQ
jgi:tetratricopeptide (TPR) repeat protein